MQTSKPLLKIENLSTKINGRDILKNFNLRIEPGEVHAVLGPNGSGKSTLAHTLAGRPDIKITKGSIKLNGKNIEKMSPEERALAGIFIAFQQPVEVPGVNNSYFLKQALNNQRQAQGQEPLDALEFIKKSQAVAKKYNLDAALLDRNLNEGFSGGEKKKNELLQLALLQPKLAVLDETDSGLDLDAQKSVAKVVNGLRDKKRAFIVITHLPKLLALIEPDYVHIIKQGQIVKSGDKQLALELDQTGFAAEKSGAAK